MPRTTTTNYPSLLKQCQTVAKAKQVHSILITAGILISPHRDAFLLLNQMLELAALSLPGDIAYASLLFHHFHHRPPSLYNTMIRAHSIRSQPDASISYYTQMLRDGGSPYEQTYPSLLKSVSVSATGSTNQIHGHIVKFGLSFDAYVRNSLLSCYAKGARMGSARKVFDESRDRDSVAWTAMVHGYVKNDRPEEGLSLFAEMKHLGVDVDEVVVVSVLNGCGMLGDVGFGKCVHGFYVECGRVKWDVYVGSALVDMYSKWSDCGDARKAFDVMPWKNVVCWTSLISGYVQCSRFTDSLSVFENMLVEGVKPNSRTLSGVLSSCGQLGALEQGRWVHAYIDRNKLRLDSVVGTSLIDMYAKCGCMTEAYAIFRILPQKDVYTWTAFINGLAMHGLALECLDAFSQMVKEGVRPNDVTFVGVLCACSHGGLVDHGRRYFNCMFEDYGIEPKLKHFGCMVDLLGRAGFLEEALRLVESMPMEPSSTVWGALFGACMIHKDFKLGESIGKHLIGVHPHHSGNYMLLANMYSVSRKWGETANLRMLMRGRSVEKARGCSFLEINGVLHEFVSSDELHFQSLAIYETLYGISMLIKSETNPSASHLVLSDTEKLSS